MTSQQSPSHRKLNWGGLTGALLLVSLGAIFAYGGWTLGLGRLTRLGPGAFPFATGVLVLGLSVAIGVFEARHSTAQADAPDWVSVFAIAAALGVFAVTVDRVGLVPGVFATILMASLPDKSLPLWGKAALGIVVALASWAIFVLGLSLPFKPFVGL